MARRRRNQSGDQTEAFGITATSDRLRANLQATSLDAVGLSRVREYLASDRGFCQITCFQAEDTFETNRRAFERMTLMLKGLTSEKIFGFWLIGHWIEERAPSSRDHHGRDGVEDTWQHALEYSWLFLQPPNLSDDDWIIAMRLMAEAHNQPAFILRTNRGQVARVYFVNGISGTSLSSPDDIISACQVLTFLRSRGSAWGQNEFDRLSLYGRGKMADFDYENWFEVHPTSEKSTGYSFSAITFYAVVPGNISSRMFYSILNVVYGG